MDEQILKKANEINGQINKINYVIQNMGEGGSSVYLYYLPKELKDLLIPILTEYQEKLFLQIKSL